MAPDAPVREPEMQDTPPCQYPKFAGNAYAHSRFFIK